MSFLQPWVLLGLPLVLVPVIIHLLNRLRHRTVEWGAMMFLLEASRQRHSRARLRHLLILVARMAAVAGLVFAVSRPLTSSWLAPFAGAPDTVIVVLDRSASMGQQEVTSGESKRSAGLRQIGDAIRTTGVPEHFVLIDSGSGEAHELETLDSLADFPNTWATDGAADMPRLLEKTLEYVSTNNVGQTEVWICSDLQASDWHPSGGQWEGVRDGFTALEQPVRFHVLAYDSPPQENLSATVASVRRVVVGDDARLFLSVSGRREGGDGRREVPLAVVVDGARSVIQVAIDGETFALENHQLSMDGDADAGWGKVELPHDANPRDNSSYFAFGEEPEKRVVIVSDHLSHARVLALAAAPPVEASLSRAEILPISAVGGIDWSDIALVLWQAPLPEGADAVVLERFVATGGYVMCFPPDGDSSPEWLGCRWGTWSEAPTDRPFSVESWRDDSGLLRSAASGRPLPLGDLEVSRYRAIEAPGTALASFASGHPLLVRAETDEGGLYFCATLPSSTSNLAREGIALVVCVQRALEAGARRLADALHSVIGEPVAFPSDIVKQVAGPGEGALSTQSSYVAGVYQIGERLMARNRPPAEDFTGTLERTALAPLLGELNYHVVDGDLAGGTPLVQESWRLFMVALIVAMLLEACLCLPDRSLSRQPVSGRGLPLGGGTISQRGQAL